MQKRTILDKKQLDLTLKRLCHQLIENHQNFENCCIIGIQPRGIHLSDRIVALLQQINPKATIRYGKLDPTFYRDDFRRRDTPLEAASTEILFSIEDQDVVLVDDVLYTGRTVRSAMDALLDFGRPSKVELLALIDRRFSRHLPVQPDYVGKVVDAVSSEVVKVEWEDLNGKDKVSIYTETIKTE